MLSSAPLFDWKSRNLIVELIEFSYVMNYHRIGIALKAYFLSESAGEA